MLTHLHNIIYIHGHSLLLFTLKSEIFVNFANYPLTCES